MRKQADSHQSSVDSLASFAAVFKQITSGYLQKHQRPLLFNPVIINQVARSIDL